MAAAVKSTNPKKETKNPSSSSAKKKQVKVTLPRAKKQLPPAAGKQKKSTAGKSQQKFKSLLPEGETLNAETENTVPELPSNYLVSLFGETIQVHLKFNNTMYRGELVSTDEYFNLRLKNTVEFIRGKESGKIGDCFIRCNTVLFINQKD